MLKIESLKETYGKVSVLDGLNMDIGESSLYGFVGLNGVEEMTTIKIIMGLLSPSSETVAVDGAGAARESEELKEPTGYMPDFSRVYDNLRVPERMGLFISCYDLDGLKARKRHVELLGQVRLDKEADFYIDGLSYGMRQKLYLARTLIYSSSLFIMDEPIPGLDPRIRYEFKEISKELREQGKAVFISSHVLSELLEICMNIGIVEQEKIMLESNMEETLSRTNTSNPPTISVFDGRETAMTILKSHSLVEAITVREEDIVVDFIGDKQGGASLLAQLADTDVLAYRFVGGWGNLEPVFMQTTDHERDEAALIHEN